LSVGSFISVEKKKKKKKKRKNLKNVNFIFYDVLVYFMNIAFSFNILEIVMEKYFKRKLDE
jgi:cell division protein FtsI/penicillin-binding protein 2